MIRLRVLTFSLEIVHFPKSKGEKTDSLKEFLVISVNEMEKEKLWQLLICNWHFFQFNTLSI